MLSRSEFISIHAAREGGDSEGNLNQIDGYISIHAAREGGDERLDIAFIIIIISIHAAREGGDIADCFLYFKADYFNPRRP